MSDPVAWAHLRLLRVYRQLPAIARRWIVRVLSPSFTVGAMAFIQNERGELLLVRQSYRLRWGVPGGLLKRRETPEAAAKREAMEEVGVAIELFEEVAVVVAPLPQRIDVVFRAVLADPADETNEGAVRPCSPEILQARWFPLDDLPELHPEVAQALSALERRAITSVLSGA